MKKNNLYNLDLKLLNIISLLILAICFTLTYILFPDNFKGMVSLVDNTKLSLLFLPILLLYLILHELLHAIGYIVNGANPKKITFGMEIEKGILYCLCKENVSKRNILFSLMYPLFFIGIVTYVIGIIFNYHLLLLLSIINISGAAGDIMYFLFIVRLPKDIEYSEMDDGASFVIVSKKPIDDTRHPGIIYKGLIDNIPRNDFKRIRISKPSIVVLVISIIALISGLLV